jgi:hypothetical protein
MPEIDQTISHYRIVKSWGKEAWATFSWLTMPPWIARLRSSSCLTLSRAIPRGWPVLVKSFLEIASDSLSGGG